MKEGSAMVAAKQGYLSVPTKTALADSLKELLQKTSFEKITIQDITKNAGVIRPTFYKH
jgi:AcrR family transcriptional regulator